MSDLVDLAIAAHGGWDRWQNLTSIKARAAIGGSIWQLKGWPDAFRDTRIAVDPHAQRVEYSPFVEPGRRASFDRGRTAIVTDGGNVVEERAQARRAFEGHGLTTRWDAQHLIYFAGYAMWTYLTTPFLFKLPGFRTEEIEPWTEDGETWRRLKVVFPKDIESHSTEQMFYFDAAGILKRHDYSVEVMGGTSSANYATEPRTIGGFVFPTKRRVYSIGRENLPERARVAVAIDFIDIEVA